MGWRVEPHISWSFLRPLSVCDLVMKALYQPFPMVEGRRAQVWHHQPSFRRPRHFHAEPELNVVTRGSGVLAVGQHRLHLRAGAVVYLLPGQDHELLFETPDFELFVIAVESELANRAGLGANQCIGQIELDPHTLTELRESWLAMRELADATTVESHLSDQFSALSRRFEAVHPVCRRTLALLRHEPELTEIAVAKRLQVHPSDVSRWLRSDIGVRLVDFRSRLRLIKFVDLVDAGSSLTRAALESGFGSYTQCHRVFRDHLGCSPSRYFSGYRAACGDLVHAELTNHLAAESRLHASAVAEDTTRSVVATSRALPFVSPSSPAS